MMQAGAHGIPVPAHGRLVQPDCLLIPCVGFDEAHPIAALPEKLPEMASDRPALYTPLGLFDDWDRQVTQLLNDVRSRARAGVSPATV